MTGSSFATSLIQGAWIATCTAEAMRFKRAANGNLKDTQTAVLREIIVNADCSEFARRHKFASISKVKDFQACVAVNDYEDLQPWIHRIAAGEQQILSNEDVLMFEETSGSTGANRLIPYTAGLQRAFNRALHPWLYDLYRNLRGLWGGPAYWVVTPGTAAGRKSVGGVPIGFANDSDYFGSWAKPLISRLMAVPEGIRKCGGGQTWRYLTALLLLRCPDLRLVSLWNPTFFTALIRAMDDWSEPLAADLLTGGCRPESAGITADSQYIGFTGPPLPQRAELLSSAVAALRNRQPAEFAEILWPQLALISCWTEAEAAAGAEQLRLFFPHQTWQTKGLLATEGAVTLPMLGAPAPVLAVRSAFYEFEEGEEGDGTVRLAHELETGGRYRVIMTTPGGLYRYRLHDIVEMRGYWRNLPCLAFVGKESMVCDLCGEKLSAAHVKSVLSLLPGHFGGAFIAPERPNAPALPGYLLVAPHDGSELAPAELAARLESALCENIHYRWSREAGQLERIQVMLLPISSEQLNHLRMRRAESENRALSTIKLGVLSKQAGWADWLSAQIGSVDGRF